MKWNKVFAVVKMVLALPLAGIMAMTLLGYCILPDKAGYLPIVVMSLGLLVLALWMIRSAMATLKPKAPPVSKERRSVAAPPPVAWQEERAVVCSYCGAKDLPDPTGCCEYCGMPTTPTPPKG